jgi:hypothetical protein
VEQKRWKELKKPIWLQSSLMNPCLKHGRCYSMGKLRIFKNEDKEWHKQPIFEMS